MAGKAFTYTTTLVDGVASITIRGEDAGEALACFVEVLQEREKGLVATGREIIEFLEQLSSTTSVDGSSLLWDEDGNSILLLDTTYSLDQFGSVDGWNDVVQPFGAAMQSWRQEQKQADPRRRSPRYPYIYAADLLQQLGPHERVEARGEPASSLPKLSRADATELQEALAPVLGVARHELAEMLAEYYLTHAHELLQRAVDRVGKLG